MTSAELRHLSTADLQTLYASLRADRLPLGSYEGRSWPIPVWPLWRGKVFTALEGFTCLGEVRNRIGPWLVIPGRTQLSLYGEVIIDYPQLSLQDRLKPVEGDALWLGQMRTKLGTIWFTLEKAVTR